jgi:glycerophosphoryl diester phosphodiesterase
MKTTLDIKNKPMRMIIMRCGIGVSLYLGIFCQRSYAAAINAGSLPCGTVLIAAHRGGYENDKADRAPENSVANILNCERKGYDLYETDIQRTKDGHFVIVHDKTIDRETTGTGPCGNMDLAKLKPLYKRYRDGSISDERVATLAEFLQVGKHRVVYKADLKPGVSEYFKEIMQQVVNNDALDGIIFRVPYRQADVFAQYKSEGVLSSRGLLMFMVSTKEQLDDIKIRFDPLMIQIDLNKSNPATPHALELIQYATSQGLLVEIHDYGTPEDWMKFLEAGARMFHTNKPSEIKAFLHNQNMNKGKSK